MAVAEDLLQEKDHYERLFRRAGDHHFIGNGYDWLHAQTIQLLDPGARILDIGCGTGHHTRLFARKGFRAAGIDICPTAVNHAREAFARWNLTGTITCADARSIPYASRSFDACFLSLVLHTTADRAALLSEAARVARTHVFVFEPNVWNPQSFLLFNVINPLWGPSFLSRNQRAVNPRRVARQMRRAGYRLHSMRFVTLGPSQRYAVWKEVIHRLQSALPRALRHTKFVQVFERSAAGGERRP